MAITRKGNVTKSNLGFLLIGDKGTYKSELCLEFLKLKNENGKPFRVLYIDSEMGSVDDRLKRYQTQYNINLENLLLVYTMSISEVQYYINKAIKNQDIYLTEDDGFGGYKESEEICLDADGKPFRADAIVIDSSTVLYNVSEQALTKFSELRATVKADKSELTGNAKTVAIIGAGLEWKDRGTLKMQGQRLILDLMASGKHYAITARSKKETERIYNKRTQEFDSVETGRIIPDGYKDLGFNAKTVLILSRREEDGTIIAKVDGKDRTEMFNANAIIEKPTLEMWSSVLKENKLIQSNNVIKNTLDQDINTEQKHLEKQIEENINISNLLEDSKNKLLESIKLIPDKSKIQGWFKEKDINLSSSTIKTCTSIDIINKAILIIEENIKKNTK